MSVQFNEKTHAYLIGLFYRNLKEAHGEAGVAVFVRMGLQDCGMVYCKEIDRGIVRGFNPDLTFELRSYLHNSDCCDMVFKNALLGEDVPANPEVKMPWDYHCGHVYKTYCENVTMIFADGHKIVDQVDAQFTEAFDQQALDVVRSYLGTDFNAI